MYNRQKKTSDISRPMKSIVLLLLLVGLSFSQDKSIDYFEWRTYPVPEIADVDQLALSMVGPAYLARTYDDYMPWWQADILAFSSSILWEVKDGLIPAEKAGFLGGEGFNSVDLKCGAIGILLNRAIPVIVKQGTKMMKLPASDSFVLSVTSKDYLKLALSLNL